jgi:zinc transporter ZupT
MTPRARRLLLLPVLATVAGVVVGVVVLAAVLLVVRPLQTEPGSRSTLGIVLLGVLLGAGCGVLVWLVGLVLAAHRLFPEKRRLGALAWSAGIVFTLAATANGITTALDDGAGLPLWAAALRWVVVAAAVLSPSVVFRIWDRNLPPGAREAPRD